MDDRPRAIRSAAFQWDQRPVVVTGGASFIGSHLVDALLSLGAVVTVADDLSSGRLRNLKRPLAEGRIRLVEGDLKRMDVATRALEGQSIVFHLAADHGGRGYVEMHEAECAGNLLLDATVFRACLETRVQHVVFASSGCVYPLSLQADPDAELDLTEDSVGPPYDADHMYGWAKLMGELTLRAFHERYGLTCASCRYFTVYGERGVENHAIIAMIARAFVRQDPFEVWGDGTQVRNWTYVGDIVRGTIRAAEVITDGRAVNLGTTERVRVLDAVREITDYVGYAPTIRFRPEMPVGPLNRVASNALAQRLLQWEPTVIFRDGVRRTLDWYARTHEANTVRERLEQVLIER